MLVAPPPVTAAAHGWTVQLGWSSVCRGNDCASVARAAGSCGGAPALVVVHGERIVLRLGFAPVALSVGVGRGAQVQLRAAPAVSLPATRLGLLRLTAQGAFEAVYELCLVSRRPPPPPKPPATTNLKGTLVLSPALPVCRAGRPCTKPLAGAILDFSQNGAVVASARTDVDGRYRVALAPGTYGLTRRTSGPQPGRGLDVQTVVVPPSASATLDLAYDAGIR